MSAANVRVLITGIHETTDNGELGQLLGLIPQLRQRYPTARFWLGEINGKTDRLQLGRVLGEAGSAVDQVRAFTSWRIPWPLRVFSLLLRQALIYPRCDLVIHLGTDGYSDQTLPSKALSMLGVVGHSYQLLCGRLFRKKVMVCSVTIGPFNAALARALARFTLNRVNLIAARENETIAYLKTMGVTAPVRLTADLAFLMEAAAPDKVDRLLREAGVSLQKPVFGLAPSQIIPHRIAGQSPREKYDLYVTAMADIVDRMAAAGQDVVLLCQTTGQKHDDREMAARIKERAKYKPIIFDNTRYTPQEMKGIMRRCEMMVSSKLHSTIFATSAGTPTVTLAYGPKIYGIVGDMLHLRDLIVDIRTEFPEFTQKLSAAIDRCWTERERLRSELQQAYPAIRDQALLNVELAAALIGDK